MNLSLLLWLIQTATAILVYPDYKDHPCIRKCVQNQTRVCYYHFTMENLFSLENECLSCLNGTSSDCSNYGCMPTDGTSRLINAYNRKIPGPSIQVCHGDEIIVDLRNELGDRVTTLHWHGMHHRGTPFMDGVPMVTQCPILPYTTFRYRFFANPPGSHMYHSHAASQRSQGGYGHLIIRQDDAVNKMRKFYDFDLQDHVISMVDWYKESTEYYINRYNRKKIFYANSVSAILVNGYGTQGNNSVPNQEFNVKQGYRYRFRLIHIGIGVCPIEFSIDKHKLMVIAADGYDLQPFSVDTIILTAGERYDFVLHAEQKVDVYWMTFKGTRLCAGIENSAILRYNGVPAWIRPTTPANFTANPNNEVANCINFPNKTPKCVGIGEMKSYNKLDERYTGKPDFVYYIEIDFQRYARPAFQGLGEQSLSTPTINSIIYQESTSPLIFNPPNEKYCNNESRQACNDGEKFCSCVHVIPVPYNKLCELVIIDKGSFQLSHPMHIHGHSFFVFAKERIGINTTTEIVKAMDKEGKIERNCENPPVKDTIPVSPGGYTIVRFISDNPGVWLFHCHVDFHMQDGMMLAFGVRNKRIKVPPRFPRCGNFLPDI